MTAPLTPALLAEVRARVDATAERSPEASRACGVVGAAGEAATR